MLFWITVGVFIILLVLAISLWHSDSCGVDTFASVATADTVIGIAIAIMLIIICINNTGLDGDIARCNTRYDMLVYQLENDIYDNDNDLGKRELIKDIQDWNEDLASYKENQDDFWIGIFIPNIYDQFEFIELDGVR